MFTTPLLSLSITLEPITPIIASFSDNLTSNNNNNNSSLEPVVITKKFDFDENKKDGNDYEVIKDVYSYQFQKNIRITSLLN